MRPWRHGSLGKDQAGGEVSGSILDTRCSRATQPSKSNKHLSAPPPMPTVALPGLSVMSSALHRGCGPERAPSFHSLGLQGVSRDSDVSLWAVRWALEQQLGLGPAGQPFPLPFALSNF